MSETSPAVTADPDVIAAVLLPPYFAAFLFIA